MTAGSSQQALPEPGGRIATLQRKAILAMVIAIVLYAGFALFADVRALAANLGRFAWWTFAAALALSAVNYVIRGARWQYYLVRLGIAVPLRASLLVFVAGFAFAVTPGKLGELLKSYFLKRDFGVEVARSAPVVVAERLTDFLALCVLLLVGIFSYQFHTVALLAAVGAVLAGTFVLAAPSVSRPLVRAIGRVPRLGRIAERLEAMTLSMAEVLRPAPLLVALLLSIAGWGCECIGLWLILHGLGVEVSLQLATFMYCATTLLGAISMLPGGLGVTEASMVSAFVVLGNAVRSSAVAATLLVRLTTLWFAVALGFVALWLYRRERRSQDLADVSAAASASATAALASSPPAPVPAPAPTEPS